MFNYKNTTISFFGYALLIIILIVNLTACQSEPVLFKREFSEAEKIKLAGQMITSIGQRYNQGSVAEAMVLEEAIRVNPQRSDLHREIGVPYGKRGLAVEFHPLILKRWN